MLAHMLLAALVEVALLGARSDVPVDTADFQPAGAPSSGGSSAPPDDDIPF